MTSTTTDKWAERTSTIEAEFSDEEWALLTARAAEKGLTVEEYLRVRLGLEP